MAKIVKYERANTRCPACDFLDDIERQMLRKFNGQFDALTKMGADYQNGQRFKPLTGNGKPLWEFKEFDHRLYCFRRIVPEKPESISVVLLNGWIKDKKGKTDEEAREISKAINLYNEFMAEFPGGVI